MASITTESLLAALVRVASRKALAEMKRRREENRRKQARMLVEKHLLISRAIALVGLGEGVVWPVMGRVWEYCSVWCQMVSHDKEGPCPKGQEGCQRKWVTGNAGSGREVGKTQ